MPPVEDVHDGYFAEAKGVPKDARAESKDAADAFERIMRKKQELLSFDEPLEADGLEQALTIDPSGLEANASYGEFLVESGQPAQALVLSIGTPKWQDASGSVLTHDYELDVRPDDGSPSFRTTVRDAFGISMAPRVGHVLAVKFSPKSHKVAFDLEGDPRYDLEAATAAPTPSWPGEAPTPPAPPAPPAASPVAPGPLDRLEQLVRLRDAGALTPEEFEAEKARVLGAS